jgi:hypothetical protein
VAGVGAAGGPKGGVADGNLNYISLVLRSRIDQPGSSAVSGGGERACCGRAGVAKARKAGPTAEELALQALRRGLERDSDARLVKAGTKPEGAGLFDGDKTGPQRAAIQLCLDQKLLEVVRTETVKSGKSVKEHRFVTVTPAGVDYLATRLAPKEAETLLRARLGQLDGQIRELELQLSQAVAAQQQGLVAIESLCAAYAQRLAGTAERLAGELRALRSQADTLRGRIRRPEPPRDRQDDGLEKPERAELPDIAESRRRLARETVVAWENISDPTAREWVEAALENAGVKPIGTAGEVTEFDGSLHQCIDPGVFSGKLVRIDQPGWLLPEARGEYLLSKARAHLVTPQSTE